MSTAHRIAGVLVAVFCCLAQPKVGRAVVWNNPSLPAPNEQTGALKHTGRLLYTKYEVFGGSCVWVGGRWVLTSRHWVQAWSAKSLRVSFPAHGKRSYAVRRTYLPPQKDVDLALLELDKPLEFNRPVTLDARVLKPQALVRFGGFGSYGIAGDIRGANKFHWGTNSLDSADANLSRFSLGKSTTAQPREALPAMFDSGSPVFLVEGQRELLAGIVVRVSHSTNPQVGDRATFTSLAGQAEWIRSLADDLRWRD